ncbi:MAG: hypothetical protein ABI647_18715 [Gemmatimonadota bacterium]
MTATPNTEPASTTPAGLAVLYGRTAEGFLAASVGDNAFAMLPGGDGRHYLASAWYIARPIAEWTRSDFHGRSGELADVAAFRAQVEENALHQRQRSALDRHEVSSRANTPWGISQDATIYADGVVSHSTAGHGGFQLSPERNVRIHPSLRAADGFYEEDCCWAAVAQALPELFTDFENACADRTIRHSFPDTWEAIHGTALEPGQSPEKDRRNFYARHAGDWIVVSAIRSGHEPDFTEVVATLGGKRGGNSEARRYLVQSAEYGASGGRFGFMIDESRHRHYDGPSSFVGWSR